MAAGTTIQYRLSWRGIPIQLDGGDCPLGTASGTGCGAIRITLKSRDGGTHMTGIVRYALPLGPIGRAAHWLAVRRNVEEIFEYRRLRIAERFGRRA